LTGLSNFAVGASDATFGELFGDGSGFGTLFTNVGFAASFLGTILGEFAKTFAGGTLFEGELFCLIEAVFAIIFFEAIGFDFFDNETALAFKGVDWTFESFGFAFPGLIFAAITFFATTFLIAVLGTGLAFKGALAAFERGFFEDFFVFVSERAIMMIYSLIEPCEWKTIQVANWQGVHP